MPELSKDIIGTKLREFTFQVERGKIGEFCRAIGETNPIYLDPAAAREAGFRDTPIPPTFQTIFMFWGYQELWEDLRNLGVDTDRLLHTKEEVQYRHPVYPGDLMTGRGEIAEVKVGKMNMVTMNIVYSNQEGQACIEARMGIAIRPEGK